MEQPCLIEGGAFEDHRGRLCFNNTFDGSQVKRIYTIQNKETDFVRAWQGHKIEQRWFSAMSGAFKLKLIAVDNWEAPSRNLTQHTFVLSEDSLDILWVPAGYISSIQSLKPGSKLLVMADYALGEVKDEYRYDADYFREMN